MSKSAVGSNHTPVPGTPEGFTCRTTYPTNPLGAEVMLEQWKAGTEEPPHSHPGDDMTVVVEGRMAVQFYHRTGGRIIPDGEQVVLDDVDHEQALRLLAIRLTRRLLLVHHCSPPFQETAIAANASITASASIARAL